MEPFTKGQQEMAAYDFPSAVDPDSSPSPSNKSMLKACNKFETTPPKSEVIARENTSCLDPASVMRPFNFHNIRAGSLPESAVSVPEAVSSQFLPSAIPGSLLPSERHVAERHAAKASPETQTVLLKSEGTTRDYPRREFPSLKIKETKKNRRSMGSGEDEVTLLEPNMTADEYEREVSSPIASLSETKYKVSVINGRADTALPRPKSDFEKYAPNSHSESLSLSSKNGKQDTNLETETATFRPHATSDGRMLRIPSTSDKQQENGFSQSSITVAFPLLPPQEWVLDTYQPTISPASIPLPASRSYRSKDSYSTRMPKIPTITVATPENIAEKPSKSTGKVQRPSEPEILDSSRLHPNAAWSQLANRAHKTNVQLVCENEILRLQNSALTDVLMRFSRVLGDMGLEDQVEFQRKLSEMPAVLPRDLR